jgi:hypothetical protein
MALLVVGVTTQPPLATTQEEDTAVTMWWVIFNNPEFCTGGGPGVCGVPDLRNEAVQTSLIWASGQRLERNKPVSFAAALSPKSTLGDVPALAPFGPGLLDPRKAEIHVVLRTHGSLLPDLAQLNEQLSSFNGGCPPNSCANAQVAIHRPAEADESGRSSSDVFAFSNHAVVPDARSTLTRRDNGVIAVVHTELP